MDVKRSITDIDKELKKITTTANQAKKQTDLLNQALQLNPDDVELVSAKTLNLNNRLSLTNKTIKLMNDNLTAMKEKGLDVTNADKYDKMRVSLALASNNAKVLNDELEGMNKTVDKTTPIIVENTVKTKTWADVSNNIAQKMDKVAEAMSKVGTISIAALTGIVALMKKASDIGEDIMENVNRYGGTAEEWQVQSNIFEKVTDNANSYSNVLSSVLTVLGNVTKEAPKTKTALAQMGLTFADLKGKSAAEALEIISEALRGIPSDAERAAAATALLGDSGKELALVLQEDQSTLDDYTRILAEKGGIISNEDVANSYSMTKGLQDIKRQLSSITVTLGTAFIPMLSSFSKIISTLTPAINFVADGLNNMGEGGQKALAIVLALGASLPALAIGIKTIDAILKASPIMQIVAAAATLLNLVTLIVASAKGSSEDTSDYDYMSDIASDSTSTVSTSNYSYSSSTSKSSVTNNTYQITVNSTENAEDLFDTFTKKARSLN